MPFTRLQRPSQYPVREVYRGPPPRPYVEEERPYRPTRVYPPRREGERVGWVRGRE